MACVSKGVLVVDFPLPLPLEPVVGIGDGEGDSSSSSITTRSGVSSTELLLDAVGLLEVEGEGEAELGETRGVVWVAISGN